MNKNNADSVSGEHHDESTPTPPSPAICVGVIGLGKMGAAMASCLVEAGFRVLGYDLDPNQAYDGGYERVDDPSIMGRECRFIMLSLPRADDLAGAVNTFDEAAYRGRDEKLCIIDSGTSLPEAQLSVAATVAARGGMFIDAPVSGGPSAARDGNLLIMVGGEVSAVSHAWPVLEAIGSKIVHLGTTGNGTRAKLLNNGLVALSLLNIAHAFRVARSHGIADANFIEVLSNGSARGNVVDNIVGAEIRGEVTQVRFAFAHLLKDVSYLNRELRRHDMCSDLMGIVEQTMLASMNGGQGMADFGDLSIWLKEDSAQR